MGKGFFSSCDSITTIFDSWACANLRFANGNLCIEKNAASITTTLRQQNLVNNFEHELVRLRVNTF